MLNLTQHTKIYCAKEPLDMRRQIDGMALIVQEKLTLDPFSQHLFLFRNKAKDKVKALYWHGNGFIALYKRLEKGCFNWPQCNAGTVCVTQSQLNGLLKAHSVEGQTQPHSTDFSSL